MMSLFKEISNTGIPLQFDYVVTNLKSFNARTSDPTLVKAVIGLFLRPF